MDESLQQSIAQGLNKADPAENVTTQRDAARGAPQRMSHQCGAVT